MTTNNFVLSVAFRSITIFARVEFARVEFYLSWISLFARVEFSCFILVHEMMEISWWILEFERIYR